MTAMLRAGRRAGHPSPAEFSTVLGAAEAARHVRIENELLRALDRDELVMHGQPVVELSTGTVTAVEMLLRWQHPVRGLLSPDAFLEVAEHSPLMGRIGRRVLAESCRIAAGWRPTAGRPAPSVFVNVSGRQLDSGTLLNDVVDALRSAGLPADRLVLELTETCAPLIAGANLTDLARLRKHGVRLAIDDVGTGYSSLARLTELPIDILKIDRSFVDRIGREHSCDAVIRAILDISRALGLGVVAEGVETRHQAELLTRYGCPTAQGFLYSRPRSEPDLQALLRHDTLREVPLQRP